MIFIDTGAWFALLAEDDEDHHAAVTWRRANKKKRLVTTDYVVAELLNLMNARRQKQRVKKVVSELRGKRQASLERVQEEDFEKALDMFQERQDKRWSFTDCVSLVVMRRLGVKIAFAFDKHFRQFGTITVVPNLVPE